VQPHGRERGLRIVREFGRLARFHNVRAAIKLQFRDVDHFIHRDFRDRTDIRYMKKTLDTRLSREAYLALVEEVRKNGCIRMATPFDERSVDFLSSATSTSSSSRARTSMIGC
jgi:N-acetylneuraminate synthase